MQRTLLFFCFGVSLLLSRPQVVLGTQSSSPTKDEKGAIKDAPDPGVINKLIQQMGNPDFAERQAATKRLEGIGKPALPALREAAKNSEDAEIRRRAQRLVERLVPQVDPLEQMLKEAGQLE